MVTFLRVALRWEENSRHRHRNRGGHGRRRRRRNRGRCRRGRLGCLGLRDHRNCGFFLCLPAQKQQTRKRHAQEQQEYDVEAFHGFTSIVRYTKRDSLKQENICRHVQVCHCETVTDVTVAAIRIPSGRFTVCNRLWPPAGGLYPKGQTPHQCAKKVNC